MQRHNAQPPAHTTQNEHSTHQHKQLNTSQPLEYNLNVDIEQHTSTHADTVHLTLCLTPCYRVECVMVLV